MSKGVNWCQKKSSKSQTAIFKTDTVNRLTFQNKERWIYPILISFPLTPSPLRNGRRVMLGTKVYIKKKKPERSEFWNVTLFCWITLAVYVHRVRTKAQPILVSGSPWWTLSLKSEPKALFVVCFVFAFCLFLSLFLLVEKKQCHSDSRKWPWWRNNAPVLAGLVFSPFLVCHNQIVMYVLRSACWKSATVTAHPSRYSFWIEREAHCENDCPCLRWFGGRSVLSAATSR